MPPSIYMMEPLLPTGTPDLDEAALRLLTQSAALDVVAACKAHAADYILPGLSYG